MRTAIVLAFLLAGCLSTPTPDSEEPAATDPPGGRISRVDESTFSVYPGNYTTDGNAMPLTPGIYGISQAVTSSIASALDGANIDFTYWGPTAKDGGPEPGPVPLIIQASPYFPNTRSPSGSQNFGQWMHDAFVPHGYGYVQLAVRSTADSGGCDDFRGPNMVADMDQAIDHLVGMEWTADSVALIGKSYPGSTPWYAAGAGNPAIKTIVPVSGSTNAWEVYNRNGTPESRAAAIVPNYGIGAITNGDRSPERKVENFACAEVYEGWAYGLGSGATGERVSADWWQERNSKPKVEANYQGSVFLVHGLEDWNVDPAVAIPWTQELADRGLVVKQWLGQWAHDYPDKGRPETQRFDWGQVLLNWFDRELKGIDVDTGPAVQVQSNDFRWRDELAWPPKDSQPLRLYLNGGGLGPEPGSGSVITGGPQANGGWSWDLAVEEDMRIAGLPLVHTTVVPHGPGGYIGATLYDVAPGGGAQRIGWTGMNFRFADGTETAKNVMPEQELLLKMQLQPMDAFVPAGHTLRLVMGYAETPTDRIQPPAPWVYDQLQGAKSWLQLPLVERTEEAFFVPPGLE